MAKKSQPWGVTLSCLLLALTCFISLYAGATSMQNVQTQSTGIPTIGGTVTDPTGLLQYMPVPTALAGASTILVIVGLLCGIFAYLLWQRNEIAWYATVALMGFSLLLNVVQIAFFGATLATPFLIGIAISAFVLLALFHKDTIRAINPDIKYNGWDLSSVS